MVAARRRVCHRTHLPLHPHAVIVGTSGALRSGQSGGQGVGVEAMGEEGRRLLFCSSRCGSAAMAADGDWWRWLRREGRLGNRLSPRQFPFLMSGDTWTSPLRTTVALVEGGGGDILCGDAGGW